MDAMVYFIIYYDLALDRVFTNQVVTRPSLNPNSTLISYKLYVSSLFSYSSLFPDLNSLNLNKNSNKYVLILTLQTA